MNTFQTGLIMRVMRIGDFGLGVEESMRLRNVMRCMLGTLAVMVRIRCYIGGVDKRKFILIRFDVCYSGGVDRRR